MDQWSSRDGFSTMVMASNLKLMDVERVACDIHYGLFSTQPCLESEEYTNMMLQTITTLTVLIVYSRKRRSKAALAKCPYEGFSVFKQSLQALKPALNVSSAKNSWSVTVRIEK